MASQRNYGLDLLRCIAMVMVLVNHGILGLGVHYGVVDPSGWFAAVFVFNFISIEWLFVLSGFLIGTMLIRSFEQQGTFWGRAKSFWLRRWFRTVPNYYLFLLINIVLAATAIAPGYFHPSYLFFSQNLFHGLEPPQFFVESWSLALDEWFYFVVPLLIGLFGLVGKMDKKASFVAATAALIVVPMVGRWFADPPVSFNDWAQGPRMTTVLHLDATGWGVMAAVAGRWFPKVWAKHVRPKMWLGMLLMAVGVWLIEGLALAKGHKPGRPSFFDQWAIADVLFARAFHLQYDRLVNVLSIFLMDIGSVLILPWLAHVQPARQAFRGFVEHVSNYSYSIYLSHYALIYVLIFLVELVLVPGPLTIAVMGVVWLAMTVGLSALNFHVFEKPVSDLRERFTRKVDANPFGLPSAPSMAPTPPPSPPFP